MKRSLGAKTLICPTPTWIVGSYDKQAKPNGITAAWGGTTLRSPVELIRLVLVLGGIIWTLAEGLVQAADAPEVPRIDSVVMSAPQPQASDEAVIWYDDFDGPEKAYTESQGQLDDAQAFGGQGRSMLARYEQGSRGTGNRKVFFGDSPTGKVVRKSQSFDDVYWRVYVKHQHGWTGGGPAKLSRATSIVSPNWSQAMIAHVWSSGEALQDDANAVHELALCRRMLLRESRPMTARHSAPALTFTHGNLLADRPGFGAP